MTNAPEPRYSPPLPNRSAIAAFRRAASAADIKPMPWQLHAARVMTALRRQRWLYREVATVVSRQNGKTTLLVPRIVMGLVERAERIMHTAQNRELPREVYGQVADVLQSKYPRDIAGKPRFANGQEVIEMHNGGRYRLVAPTRGGARGPANDLVIVDEVREMEDFTFIAAAQPTLTASRSPQMLYLSNAGHAGSVVLNSLRRRGADDPNLAYTEWSAAPGRAVSDRDGWAEANPALGYTITMDTLEGFYSQYAGAGELAIFETEHLCRWVQSMLPRLVSDVSWTRAEASTGEPTRPAMGINVAPEGTRASAVLAWRTAGFVALTLAAEVAGNPIDLDAFGEDLAAWARKYRVREIGFDPWTDKDLARHLPDAKPIAGQEFAGATERFVNTVESGALRWESAGEVGADLAFTSRKYTAAAYQAVRAQDDRPVTAAMAAIRAVYLATAPRRGPRLY